MTNFHMVLRMVGATLALTVLGLWNGAFQRGTRLMAASKDTVTDVYMVMQRHLPLHVRTKVINDLAEVRGNASFTKTVKMLKALHERLLNATGNQE
jgi:hypothetical protein